VNYGLFILATFTASVVIAALVVAATFVSKLSRDDPTAWARAIRKFEKEDRHSPPAGDLIVFTGSSSIRYWKTLRTDMASLAVLNRGFGGSRIHDVTYYVNRIVLQHTPRAVVLYAGENDIAGMFLSRKKTAAEVREAFQKFCEEIHSELPVVPIYFISIKPPKTRLRFWPTMQAANQLVREYCASDQRLHFVDIVSGMLETDGKPRRDFFKWDGIHLNAKGYAIWISIIRPILTDAFPGSRV
jgi:lysophospholipase L1-like esterase